MKCDAKMTNAHGEPFKCKATARWWWNQEPGIDLPWHPRCGRHAAIPPFTKRERVPITDPIPSPARGGAPEWVACQSTSGDRCRKFRCLAERKCLNPRKPGFPSEPKP